MIATGELEIARDELRWLLSECHDFQAAHKLLGDLAVAEGDWRLARGHYGYAYQLGVQAIGRIPTVDQQHAVQHLPYAITSNQIFFQAGRELAKCLLKLNKRSMAREVIGRLLQLDPHDALGIRHLLDEPLGPRRKHR